MFSTLYGAAPYARAEYGLRNGTSYALSISEAVTSAYVQASASLFNTVLTNAITAAATMANVAMLTAAPPLRTFLIPVEKRNPS